MLTALRRWFGAHVPPLALDVSISGLFTVLAVLDLVFPHGDDGYQAGPVWLNLPLSLLMTVPLAFRRIVPRTTFAIVYGAAVLPVPHTVWFWAGFLPVGFALYTMARETDRWPARWSWASGVLLALALDVAHPDARGWGDVFFSGLLYAAAWGAGRTMRRLDLQGRALSRTLTALAAEQAAREEDAVEAERARIAVEMHDVVAHAVSLMVVQLGATRMELERDRGRQPRLWTAEQTGREALVELRRALGVLRSDSADAARQPLPDLAAIPALVASVRAAGLDVAVDVEYAGALPASTQLTVYRILQEALTNALAHGSGDAAASVSRRGNRLVIAVQNGVAGPPAELPGEAHGLAGMRARVSMYQGTLSAGRVGDRFEVRAELPLDPAPVLDGAR